MEKGFPKSSKTCEKRLILYETVKFWTPRAEKFNLVLLNLIFEQKYAEIIEKDHDFVWDICMRKNVFLYWH